MCSFFALYKGVIPKMLKLGPGTGVISHETMYLGILQLAVGGAIMFVVYEQVSLWLTNLNL